MNKKTQRSRITGGSDTTPTISIDYLSVSFLELPGVLDECKRIFGGSKPWLPVAGQNGFDSGLQQGRITIFHGGNDSIWVELRGQGCRQIEAERKIENERDWMGFVDQIDSWGGRVKRLDFAIDDRAALVKMSTVFGKMRRGELTGRFRNGWECNKYEFRHGQVVGKKAVFGGAESDYQVVIYDKASEQEEKGMGVEGHWTRVEVRAKGQNAVALSRAFVENGFDAIIGDLRARLAFRVRPKGRDSNRSRWKVCRWWVELLRCSPKLVPCATPQKINQDLTARMITQYGPTLAQFAEEHGGDAVQAILDSARQREARKAMRKVNTSPLPESRVMRGVRTSRQLRARMKGRNII